jgi:tRNA(Ile)-lysidine synthase
MPPSPNSCSDISGDHDAVSCFIDTLRRHHMAAPGDRLLVAVSGGPDSVALVHLLHAVAPDWRLSLGVAHVDHGLQSNAASAARFVAGLAGDLGLPCHQTRRDVAAVARHRRLSIEAAGRDVRYAYFSDLCIRHGYRRVAVGHHRDDCAEQVVMNLARGSGLTGLSGIAPVRDDWVIRPLIGCSRSSILDYLDRSGLTWQTDPSNADRRMTRNRVRHDILPIMARHLNPGILDTLARTADIIGAEDAWLETIAARQLTAASLGHSATGCTLSATALAQSPLPLQRRMIRLAIHRVKGDLQRIGHVHIDAVLALLDRDGGRAGVHLPTRVLVTREYDELQIRRCTSPLRNRSGVKHADAQPAYCIRIPGPPSKEMAPLHVTIDAIGAVMTMAETGGQPPPEAYTAGHHIAFFDMGKLEFPLTLRSVAPGDRFQPLGMDGTQKVYKLLRDLKTPSRQRATTPVLVSGGAIVWVPGIKMGQSASVSADTRRVVRAEMILPPAEK